MASEVNKSEQDCTLYQALFEKENPEKGFISTKFDKKMVTPSSLIDVIGKNSYKLITHIWNKEEGVANVFSPREREVFLLYWKNRLVKTYDLGWCYGLSIEFLLRLGHQPDATDIQLMKAMKLGDAMVYQASQHLFNELKSDIHSSPNSSKNDLDKLLAKDKFPGIIKTELKHFLTFKAFEEKDMMEIFSCIGECIKKPDCIALRLSVSGKPGHSVVCQVSPRMRIFDPASGIHTPSSFQELVFMLVSGLEQQIQLRIDQEATDGTVSIISYTLSNAAPNAQESLSIQIDE